MMNIYSKSYQYHLFFIFLSSIFLSAGCTTTLTSERAGNDTDGIRYWLPAPHLMVTPQPNGQIKVDIVYLPDPSNAYVLRVDSAFSNYTLNAVLENGLLTTVTLDSKNTDLASSVAGTAGSLVEARIKAAEAVADAEEEQAQEVRQATDALAVAEAKLNLLRNPPPGVAVASQDLLQAELAVAEARTKLALLTGNAPADSDDGFNAFNAPGTGDMAEFSSANGPVLFRIIPITGGVQLVAVEEQRQFPTSTAAVPQTPNLQFTPSGTITVERNESGQLLQMDLTANRVIASVDTDATELFRPDSSTTDSVASGNDIAVAIVGSDRKVIRIGLPASTSPGNYQLIIATTPVDGQKQSTQIGLVVR